MKKSIILLGILVAANIVIGQGREEMRAKAEVKIEQYRERLNLTDQQVEELDELKEKYAPEAKAIRDDDDKSRSDKMRAMADLIDEREAELAQILDEEQMEEFQAIRKEVRENVGERRERRRKHHRDGR